jgi:hypothetical protein
MPFHSIAIRIVSSYLQVSGMLLQFDLDLPDSVRSLVVIEASASSLSEQLLLFDCATHIRNDEDMFFMRQIMSSYVIPIASLIAIKVFWACRGNRRQHRLAQKKNLVTAADGAVSSIMVLFYTLFPAIVNKVALVFSCKTYGDPRRGTDRLLLTEAMSVECLTDTHFLMILTIGAPVVVLYLFLFPGLISLLLIRNRRREELYPYQRNYKPQWTIRLGFMFAGYREGYEWWESAVLVRKALVFLLSIFLKSYGTTPQVVAAGMVLVIALSFQLQYQPYQNRLHNWIESLGLHTCLIQILVVLMGNMIGRVNATESDYDLGPVSSITIIVTMFTTTILFFWQIGHATVSSSQHIVGVVGAFSRCLHRACPRICKPATNSKVIRINSRIVGPASLVVDKNISSGGGGGKESSSVPLIGATMRRATGRHSLKYNVQVLQHLRKSEEGIKNYEKTTKEHQKKIGLLQHKSNSRLQQRLKLRRRESMTRDEAQLSTKVFPAGKDAKVTLRPSATEDFALQQIPGDRSMESSSVRETKKVGAQAPKKTDVNATKSIVLDAKAKTATKKLPPNVTKKATAESKRSTKTPVNVEANVTAKSPPLRGGIKKADSQTPEKTAASATKSVSLKAKAKTETKKLSPNETKKAAEALKLKMLKRIPTPEKLLSILNKVDKKHTGSISFHQFKIIAKLIDGKKHSAANLDQIMTEMWHSASGESSDIQPSALQQWLFT